MVVCSVYLESYIRAEVGLPRCTSMAYQGKGKMLQRPIVLGLENRRIIDEARDRFVSVFCTGAAQDAGYSKTTTVELFI